MRRVAFTRLDLAEHGAPAGGICDFLPAPQPARRGVLRIHIDNGSATGAVKLGHTARHQAGVSEFVHTALAEPQIERVIGLLRRKRARFEQGAKKIWACLSDARPDPRPWAHSLRGSDQAPPARRPRASAGHAPRNRCRTPPDRAPFGARDRRIPRRAPRELVEAHRPEAFRLAVRIGISRHQTLEARSRHTANSEALASVSSAMLTAFSSRLIGSGLPVLGYAASSCGGFSSRGPSPISVAELVLLTCFFMNASFAAPDWMMCLARPFRIARSVCGTKTMRCQPARTTVARWSTAPAPRRTDLSGTCRSGVTTGSGASRQSWSPEGRTCPRTRSRRSSPSAHRCRRSAYASPLANGMPEAVAAAGVLQRMVRSLR